MKQTRKLLLIAAFIVLALPLMFTSQAGAVVYNPDGLVLNGTTGLWELPDNTGANQFMGCYDGTTTLNSAATRFACRNVAVPSLTTASTCGTSGSITTPAGWVNSPARWSGCSEGGYSANSTDPATDCVLAGGGTTNVFTRCNRGPRSISTAECTSLPGYTFVAAGTDAGSYTCTTTGMNATQCAAFTAVTSPGGYNVLGSAAVSGVTTTCTIYFADATGCTAASGTLSTANTDETRGYCGGNWVFKTGTAGNWGSSVRNNCVKCHQPAYMDGATASPAGEVAKYANASHKNASRKIVPGMGLANVWIDTDGNENFGVFPYLPGLNSPQTDSTVSPNYNIRMVDWVNGKIEDTTGGLRNLPTGVFTEWYWEFGYYGEDPERGTYNGEAGANGKPSAKNPACFACHATGYAGVAALDTNKEPEKSFPGISWNFVTTYTPGSRPGKVNLQNNFTNRVTNVKGTYTYGNWDEYGVVCSKCHNAAGGGHTSGGDGAPNPTTGLTVNAVCGQCHIRAGSGDWAVTAGTGVLTTRAQVGTGHPNYHATDFLNSPHARFTGTYSQVATASMYNSAFMTSYAGCVGCHNPHGSVREPLHELALGNAAPLEGIEDDGTCAACHATVQGSAVAVTTNINHPTGPGTPADTPDECATCHMPSGRHLFRITTDANYTTTQPTAFPQKADGTFLEAVWVDMKSACIQCHNGTVAFHFSETQAGVAATGMHDNTTPGAVTCTDCHNATSTPSIIPAFGPTKNHHGAVDPPYGCTYCHADTGTNARHDGTSPAASGMTANSYCLTCHVNTGLHAVHHAVATVPGTCVTCHDPGVPMPTPWANSQCQQCHTSTIFNTATLKYPMGAINCTDCHGKDGLSEEKITKPTAGTQVCFNCHYVGGPGIPLDQTEVNNSLPNMHSQRPVANFTVGYGAATNIANVDGTSSTCPVGPCTYDFNWGDLTAHGATVTGTHTYATSGAKTITLTVTDTFFGTTSIATRTFNAFVPNVAPTAACAGGILWNANTWTATCLTDNSSDAAPGTVTKTTMNWGDGGMINTCLGTFPGQACAMFTRTYANPGLKNIVHTAFDNSGATGTETLAVTPAYFTISGTVQNSGVANVAGAMVQVKKGAAIVTTVLTNSLGVFTTPASLKPGVYTLFVTKSGYTFASPAATITVGPSSSGNVIHSITP